MARKRKTDHENIVSKEGNAANWDEAEAVAELGGVRRARKRFVGVRQRPSGRWVAEIKDTIHKIRVWLGTFNTAEEAARAYDEAACLLRGANTRTNFWPCSPNSSSNPVLPSKITNLLISRLQGRNRAVATEPSSDNNLMYIDDKKSTVECEVPNFSESKFADFLNDHDEDYAAYENNNLITISDYETQNFDSCQTSEQNSFELVDVPEMEEERDTIQEVVDFQFLDEIGSSMEFSPFEIAAEISKLMDQEEEPLMLSEAMERRHYERKFSASLYAFNGITEWLKVKQGNVGRFNRSDQISRLKKACKSNQEEVMMMMNNGIEQEKVNNTINQDEDSLNYDGESLLWNSIDLPPICFVN